MGVRRFLANPQTVVATYVVLTVIFGLWPRMVIVALALLGLGAIYGLGWSIHRKRDNDGSKEAL